MFSTDRPLPFRLPIALSLGWIAGCGSDPVTPPPPPPPPAVASVELEAPAGVLEAGATLALTARAKDAGGATMSGVTIGWLSSATTVATVDNAGLVRGVAAGPATITASAGGKSASVALAVRDTTTPGTSLSGRIERVRLTLPAGRTYRVEQDLTIEVDSGLTIAGTIEVVRGASLTVVAKRIDVTGAIGSALPQPAASRRTVGRSAAGPGTFTSVTQDFYTSGDILFPGPMQFAGNGPNSTVLVDGVFVGPDAALAGTAASRDGEAGYPLDIGSPAAIAGGQGPGRTPGPITDLLVRAGGKVQGGLGGAGFSVVDRADAAVTGNLLFAQTGSGGRGGDVVIVSNRIDNAGQIRGGEGRTGGSIGTYDIITQFPETYLALRDGSGPAGEGENLEAILEPGGAGGDLSIVATTIVGAGTIELGPGGWPPHVLVVGGNGAAGGPGGYQDVELGSAGPAGRATVIPQVPVLPPPPQRHHRIDIKDAANGSPSLTAGKPGGAGGAIAYQWDPTIPKPLFQFRNAAQGGAGFDGCAAPLPGPGGDGGPGGTMDVGDGTIFRSAPSFNGGHGGRGLFRTGRGGRRGDRLTPTPGPLGDDGLDGINCGSTFLTISPTAISVEVINSANGCGPTTYGGQGVRFTNRLSYDLTILGTITHQQGNSLATFGGQQSKLIVVPANGTATEPISGDTCLPSNDNKSTIGFSTEDAATVISSIPLDVRCTLNCFAGGPPAVPKR
jgi:hypothetical protein